MSLLVVGTLRELFGLGTLLGYTVLPSAEQGGWFTPLGLMLLAPSAFFILGLLIWMIRALRPQQIESDEFEITADVRSAR